MHSDGDHVIPFAPGTNHVPAGARAERLTTAEMYGTVLEWIGHAINMAICEGKVQLLFTGLPDAGQSLTIVIAANRTGEQLRDVVMAHGKKELVIE